MNPTDQDLALKAASGDRVAFATLLDRHYDRFYGLAWRFLGSRTDAEDVAQDVCVKLATAIRSFRGEAEFTTWAWRITYHAAADKRRSTTRMQPVDPADIAALAERPAEGDAASILEAKELWASVHRLPEQQRDAVILVYGEDMSHAEAACVMGCTEKTVSWHLHAARKRLKAMLDDSGLASSQKMARRAPVD